MDILFLEKWTPESILQVSTKGNHNQGIPDTGGADGMNDRKGGTADEVL
jgi:hypothetical protein